MACATCFPTKWIAYAASRTPSRAACRAWGYREVRTPVVEPLHLFTSAGTLSPQTLEGVYSFLDWDGWSGERVVLRPDSTIPAARLYTEQLDGGRTAKLFYTQNIFHFTADGSSREEWQCGVELIGDTGSSGDVELALLALETLRPLGLHDITVRLSHAGIVRGVLAAAGLSAEEQSAAYDRLLDADLTVVDEVEARLPQLTAPLRLLFEVEGQGAAYITNLREPLTAADTGARPRARRAAVRRAGARGARRHGARRDGACAPVRVLLRHRAEDHGQRPAHCRGRPLRRPDRPRRRQARAGVGLRALPGAAGRAAASASAID